MQKSMADNSIDKFASSAIALINNQPPQAQDSAASVWVTGACVVADSIEISLREMAALEVQSQDRDFIRMEAGWNTVKASVVCAVTGLKGIFSFMDTSDSQSQPSPSPQRSASIASASAVMFRRLSNAFVAAPPSTAASSRSSSIASLNAQAMNNANSNNNHSISNSNSAPVYRTPNYVRNSISKGCPTSLPDRGNGVNFAAGSFFAHKLSTIPLTPEADESTDPFDMGAADPMPEMLAMHAEAAKAALELSRMSQAVV